MRFSSRHSNFIKTVGFAHTHKLFEKSLIKNFIENRTLCGFLEKTVVIT